MLEQIIAALGTVATFESTLLGALRPQRFDPCVCGTQARQKKIKILETIVPQRKVSVGHI